MKEFCLYDLEQVGVIILDDGGAVYYNQTGGTACMQPRAKGFFVPISNDAPLGQDELDLASRLGNATRDSVGLSKFEAVKVNQLLKEVSSSDLYTVDESKLDLSNEAWVYLDISPQGEFSHFDGYSKLKAILTWPNSD